MIERVERPWGYFETYYKSSKLMMKRLVVNPGQRLSLQSHENRKKYWVVEEGIAHAILNGHHLTILPGESIEVPKKKKHRLCNPGDKMLVVAETGWGDIDEEDIMRYEDDYGRMV